MSDTKRGVGTQTKKSNLAVNDCIRNSEVLKDAWVIIKEVRNLVKNSPCRETKLKEIREMTKNSKIIRVFFRLPWTIHGEMCASVFNNPEDLMKLWI